MTRESASAPAESAVPEDEASSVLFVPVHGPQDELAAGVLSQLRQARGAPASAASPHLLTAELLDAVRLDPPAAICLVTVRADNIARIDLICRRLSDERISCPVIVGAYDVSADSQRLRRRLNRHANTRIC